MIFRVRFEIFKLYLCQNSPLGLFMEHKNANNYVAFGIQSNRTLLCGLTWSVFGFWFVLDPVRICTDVSQWHYVFCHQKSLGCHSASGFLKPPFFVFLLSRMLVCKSSLSGTSFLLFLGIPSLFKSRGSKIFTRGLLLTDSLVVSSKYTRRWPLDQFLGIMLTCVLPWGRRDSVVVNLVMQKTKKS
jgi:hypothetical protein